MMEIVMTLFSACGQGITWGVMALGVFITFKLLNFADMTCDGSFAMGGCISIVCTQTYGMNPFLSLILAVIGGMSAGFITGILNTKLKIPPILSGILTMISLYSINLHIMSDKANLAILRGNNSMIDIIKSIVPAGIVRSMKDTTLTYLVIVLLGILAAFILIFILYWFFGTEIGSAIRATGDNEDMIRALGQNTDSVKIIALMVGNGLIALSGSLVSQQKRVADIGDGQGAIVIGLASIIIGEVLFGKKVRKFKIKLLSVIIGSVVYRAVISMILYAGMPTADLKLLTAVIVAVALAFPVLHANRMGGYKKALRKNAVEIESAKTKAFDSNED